MKPDWCAGGGGGGADIEHFLIVVTGRRHSINSCDTAVGRDCPAPVTNKIQTAVRCSELQVVDTS